MTALRVLLVAALAGSALSLAAAPASAEPAPVVKPIGGEGGSSTAAFVGLQWNFGSNAPALTGGIRWLEGGDDDSVHGAKVDASMPLTTDFLPTIRVLGIYGNDTVQGEAGVGYDFGKNTFVLGAGVQLPYVNAGLNIGLDGSISPTLGFNSLGKPVLGGGDVTCPANTVLTEVTGGPDLYDIEGMPGYPVPASAVTNGYTCLGQFG